MPEIKKRIFQKIKGAKNLFKILYWDPQLTKYVNPPGGTSIRALRPKLNEFGRKIRETRCFPTLTEAIDWQQHLKQVHSREEIDTSPSIGEVYTHFVKMRFSAMARSTRLHYEKLFLLYFGEIENVKINSLSSTGIDAWILSLKKELPRARHAARRKSFRHELKFLITLLNHYQEYNEDPKYRNPIRKRHRKDIRLHHNVAEKLKDISEDEFCRFLCELKDGKFGGVLMSLATMQYYQALRISEAASLYYEDLLIDWHHPHKSNIAIRRHLDWGRQKGVEDQIISGYKNSKFKAGSKMLPLQPEVFEALKPFLMSGGKGLIFKVGEKHFSYRQIQHAYDIALSKAKLPYTATHIMRHGGSRLATNETNGDYQIAGQLLGNTAETTLIYAKRDQSALQKYIHGRWAKHSESKNDHN